jgi:hypothetical protein
MNGDFRIFLRVPDWLKYRWWRVAYLIPAPFVRERFGDLLELAPDERFNSFVAEQLTAVLEGGKAPPEDIAPAIMNLADDLQAGREMTLRAGDYITLQNHLRRA